MSYHLNHKEETNINNITVIDAPCGAGKTSWAFQYINAHPDKRFIFCTPYLDQIERIKEKCPDAHFREPLPFKKSKLEDFNNLLEQNRNIAVTHATFLNSTVETMELIRMGGYTLILDEVIEVITDFNKAQTVEDVKEQHIRKGDIEYLTENESIYIDESKKVEWIGRGAKEGDYKYSEVERFANLGRLYCINNAFLVVFPPETIAACDEVYLLTYMFETSTCKHYFDLYGISYETKSLIHDDSGYCLIPYDRAIDIHRRMLHKEFIHICDNKTLNNYTARTAMSKNWYNHADGHDMRRIKSHLRGYFERYVKKYRHATDESISSEFIMWTCPKAVQDKLIHDGYRRTEDLTKEDMKLPAAKQEKLKTKYACFVSCNARASNDYENRWILAYCANIFYNPTIRHFLQKDNDQRKQQGLEPICPNDDHLAISFLIQWIYRSRIRKDMPEPIEIYLPSQRMRKLLQDWLDGKI